MHLHLYCRPDQENYASLLKPLVRGHSIQMSMSTPVTLAQVSGLAKTKGASVIICNEVLLGLLVRNVGAGTKDSYSLDDYAGSCIEHDGVTYLVCNPPEHIVTTPTGRFLWARYLSKLLQPHRWPAQPVFRWTLANPSNIEGFYHRYAVTADLIAVDIETVSTPANAITCCVFSTVSFVPDTNGCPYTIENLVIPVAYAEDGQQEYMLSWLRRFCDLPAPKITQNGKYDHAWLIAHHSPARNWLFDTASMFHCWFAELPKRLDPSTRDPGQIDRSRAGPPNAVRHHRQLINRTS